MSEKFSNRNIQEEIEKYYNNQKIYFDKLINPTYPKSNLQFVFENDQNGQYVEIYENKPILAAKYRTIGTYDPRTLLWHWGWLTQFSDNKMSVQKNIVEKFNKRMIDEYSKKNNSKYTDYIHFVTKNGYFILDKKNIDKFIQIALFALRTMWIFPVKRNNIIEYISIDQITKIYNIQ